jgi:ATP-binding cassette subfamily B protein
MTEPESDAESPAFTYHELQRRRSSKPLRELPSLLGRAVRLVWTAGRRNAIVLLVLAVAQAVLALAQLVLVQRVLRELPDLSQGASVRTIAPEVAGFAAVFVAESVVALLDSQVRQVLGEEVARLAQSRVARAAAAADLIDYERPGFHDRLQRSLANSSSRPLQTTFALVNLVAALLTLATGLVVLLSVAPLLVPLLIVAFGPLWLVLRRFTRIGYEFSIAESEADRRRSYFLWLLTSKELATELRSYQLAGEFDRRHDQLWEGRLARLRSMTARRIRLGVIGRLVNGLLLAAVLALLLWMVSTDRADVADAGVAAGALFLISQRLGMMVGATGTLYECSLFLDDLEGFLADQQRRGEQRPTGTIAEPLEVLRASDVTFRYPAGVDDALQGVDVEVRPGEMIALVGVNGSGKTTLAKVLAGLLPPTSGTVSWNDQDVATIDPERWRDHVAIVQQDYARYLLTLRENVALGRVERSDDVDALLAAIDDAGVTDLARSLPDGIEHLLGPQYIGGADLSGGQWQRVALARAFFRDAPVLILDEPSASLDAEAEAALFERVQQLCTGRAVIVISHRFSTVRHADRIFVLERGHIIERGQHNELVAAGGTYAKLFALQAAWYRSPSEEVNRA